MRSFQFFMVLGVIFLITFLTRFFIYYHRMDVLFTVSLLTAGAMAVTSLVLIKKIKKANL